MLYVSLYIEDLSLSLSLCLSLLSLSLPLSLSLSLPCLSVSLSLCLSVSVSVFVSVSVSLSLSLSLSVALSLSLSLSTLALHRAPVEVFECGKELFSPLERHVSGGMPRGGVYFLLRFKVLQQIGACMEFGIFRDFFFKEKVWYSVVLLELYVLFVHTKM